jgi:WD40 repeat protein
MNSRISCLLLILIAHASATAAPQFPLMLHAAISAPPLFPIGTVNALSWSHDGKTLASNGDEIKFDDRGKKIKVDQLLLWDAVNWGRKPKERITIKDGVVTEMDFFDPKDSTRLALLSRGYGILNLKRPKDAPRIFKQKRFVDRKVHWSRDGKKFAFTKILQRDFQVTIVDGVSGKTLHTLNRTNALKVLAPGREYFGAVADWSPDGKYLLTSTGRGLVVFDNKLEEELFRFDFLNPAGGNFNANLVGDSGWNPLRKEVVFRDKRMNLHFLDLKGLEENEDPIGAPSRLKKLKADSSFPMKDSEGVLLQKLLDQRQISSNGAKLEWGPQGRRIAVTYEKKVKNLIGRVGGTVPAIIVYSPGGKLLHEFVVKNVFIHPAKPKRHFRVISFEWSPDGSKIAAGLDDGTIRVFKTSK